ncbi:MAG: TolC family protein [Candidatus Krumholzibacteriia bacterium]
MRPKPIPVVLALLLACAAMTAYAQPRPPLPPLARAVLDSAVVAELANLPGAPLTLDDARALAATGATAVRLADATAAAARGSVRREQGAYDPELYGQAAYQSADAATANPFSGADVLTTEDKTGELGVRWTTTMGTELTASLNAVRQETNSSLALLRPQYDTFGELRLVQPLLEGFGAGQRGDLTAAERSLAAAEIRAAGARLSTTAQVDQAYWALYAAGRDFTVQRIITESAEGLLDQAETRRRAGLVGPADVANARVFLATQRQVLLDAEEALGQASDQLASLLGRRPADGQPLYHPTSAPPAAFPVPAPDQLVATAFRSNHELRGLGLDVAAVQARREQARRNALPTLDVFGALGGAGLSGAPRSVTFGGTTYTTDIDGGLGDALGQVLKRDYPSWQVGLTFAIPLGNRADGGEAQRLDAEVVRAEQQLEAARRRLEEQVRAAHRALAGGNDRLEAARYGLDAATEQVRIGVLDYENGRTSAFELVRLAGDLATAQQRYSRALVRTASAAAVLRQLTGGAYPSEETRP